jgi:hypothetical protein
MIDQTFDSAYETKQVIDTLENSVKMLIAERVEILEQRDKDIASVNEQLITSREAYRDLNRKVVMNNTALVSWFQDNLNESDEDEITISLDDINAILKGIGLAPISRISEYAVRVRYSNTGTVYVKASSEDEANNMVENASFWIETDGDFESCDFESYNSEITLDGTEVSS